MRELGGGPTRRASSTIGEPVRVAGSGPAEPRTRRSARRGAKANGVQTSPVAAGSCGERVSAVRVTGASTERTSLAELHVPTPTYSYRQDENNRCVDTVLINSIITDKDCWEPLGGFFASAFPAKAPSSRGDVRSRGRPETIAPAFVSAPGFTIRQSGSSGAFRLTLHRWYPASPALRTRSSISVAGLSRSTAKSLPS